MTERVLVKLGITGDDSDDLKTVRGKERQLC